MNNPSLMDWLFNKDNPPDNKDNLSKVKMSCHSDPRTGSFVSTLVTDQPPFHSTTTCIKNDDMIMKIAMSWALIDWGFDSDNPPDDDTVLSFQYNKTEKLVTTIRYLPSLVHHSFQKHR